MSNLNQSRLQDLVDNFDNQRIPLSVKQRSTLEKKYRYYGAQGVIDHVDDYSGNIVFTVSYRGEELLIPFHEEMLVSYSESEGTLTLNLPDGLIDA